MDYLIPVYTDYGDGMVSMTEPLQSNFKDKAEFYERDPHMSPPKTKAICDVEHNLRLYVSFFDVDVGHLTIRSHSRKKAYQVATILRALFSLHFGWQPNERTGHYYLQELKRLPRGDWDNARMLSELRGLNYGISDTFIYELHHGFSVSHDAYLEIPRMIEKTWRNEALVESLNHMLESRFLFCGFMVGSYYTCHYSKDRRATPIWEIEKRYFENRFRYETAFLAAFKGIERFFGVNDINKHQIPGLLSSFPHSDISETTPYRRFHEIFSGLRENDTYSNMIRHFLKLRNAVAAHGNRKPPKDCMLIEDNVFEIQLFLMELLNKAIFV